MKRRTSRSHPSPTRRQPANNIPGFVCEPCAGLIWVNYVPGSYFSVNPGEGRIQVGRAPTITNLGLGLRRGDDPTDVACGTASLPSGHAPAIAGLKITFENGYWACASCDKRARPVVERAHFHPGNIGENTRRDGLDAGTQFTGRIVGTADQRDTGARQPLDIERRSRSCNPTSVMTPPRRTARNAAARVADAPTASKTKSTRHRPAHW